MHRLFLPLLLTTSLVVQAQRTTNLQASYALIHRILPAHADAFIVESLPPSRPTALSPADQPPTSAGQPSGPSPTKDSFELESRGNKIILRGNNGVAIASALYYYLQNYCHCQITWNGTNLRLPTDPGSNGPVQHLTHGSARLPTRLPAVSTKIGRHSPYPDRYYLNYCTFNYSMSWWDWPRWEKEIDWMALHGINMPLAITGEEYTWWQVYKEMGFSDEELNHFFSGPAYFAWLWMGNLDGWGGPLTPHWMTGHRDLQLRILRRERALGMTPVLPAFTGHVPPSFQKHFSTARLKHTNWKNGFADTYILDAEDSLFAVIGKKFLQTQTRLFGTDHLYSSDTFNENEPPSDDPAALAALSRRLYEGMRQADTAATWVMQGWLFYSDRKFWKAPQIKALLDAVPGDHLLLLDLAAEIEPIWKSTHAFYGKPWIWNMIDNFGGNVNLFGRMDVVASGPSLALKDSVAAPPAAGDSATAHPASGKLIGIGLTMEAIEQNPVIYELMMQNAWQSEPVDLDTWLAAYVRNRYGFESKELLQAWAILHQTVYNGLAIRDGAESILTGRPTFDSTTVWTRTKLNYPPQALLPAWDLFIHATSATPNTLPPHKAAAAATTAPATTVPPQGPAVSASPTPTEGFLFDLTDLTRQVLANYADALQKQWVAAFRAKDSAAFTSYSGQFITLIEDMDRLLATRRDFLLGPWLTAARKWGATPAEADRYEKNARDLITLWGDAGSPLHEYANRQWSGLLNDFYKVRWQRFFTLLQQSLHQQSLLQQSSHQDTAPDLARFEKEISAWEWHWVNEHHTYPSIPTGDSRTIALQLYHKYRQTIAAAYE